MNRNEIEARRMVRSACCDIFNGEDQVILRLEMPGVTKKDLDVKVDNDLLIISGKKELANVDGKYLIREIKSGDYHQEFTLDDTIDRQNIDASIKNGVVTIVLSLKESEKPKKIQVKTG